MWNVDITNTQNNIFYSIFFILINIVISMMKMFKSSYLPGNNDLINHVVLKVMV